MSMTGPSSLVHFAEVTHWTLHRQPAQRNRAHSDRPRTAGLNGITDRDEIRVESPRDSVTRQALLWAGIRQDTVFVPNTRGPAQSVGEIFGTPCYEPATPYRMTVTTTTSQDSTPASAPPDS